MSHYKYTAKNVLLQSNGSKRYRRNGQQCRPWSDSSSTRRSLIRVCTVSHTVCIFWSYNSVGHKQGTWTLSMISYRSVKMTSNYPTSCLEVRRKQKVNKPIFKGCPRKNVCKYQHFNKIVFSCSACLQKKKCLSDNYAIIVRYAIYKAWSLHKGQLTLHDAIVSHHQNCWIVTFKPWSCLQYYVHKNDRHEKKLQACV